MHDALTVRSYCDNCNFTGVSEKRRVSPYKSIYT